jgi:hypothetical protein
VREGTGCTTGVRIAPTLPFRRHLRESHLRCVFKLWQPSQSNLFSLEHAIFGPTHRFMGQPFCTAAIIGYHQVPSATWCQRHIGNKGTYSAATRRRKAALRLRTAPLHLHHADIMASESVRYSGGRRRCRARARANSKQAHARQRKTAPNHT